MREVARDVRCRHTFRVLFSKIVEQSSAARVDQRAREAPRDCCRHVTDDDELLLACANDLTMRVSEQAGDELGAKRPRHDACLKLRECG